MADQRAKRKHEDEDSDDGDNHEQQPKRAKRPLKRNEEGDIYFDLDKKKRATIREFKGRKYVDIREYYIDNNGNHKPGRKGLMLNAEAWGALRSKADKIDEALHDD